MPVYPGLRGKRKASRPSTGASSREVSPARSGSPAKDRRREKEKGKRPRRSEEEASNMDLDEEPRGKAKAAAGKERPQRAKVTKVHLSSEKGKDNPKWIPEADVGAWVEHRDSVSRSHRALDVHAEPDR